MFAQGHPQAIRDDMAAVWDKASGNLRHAPGDGPDPARAALNAALQERGIDPAEMTNDEIAAALGEGASAEYGQAGRSEPIPLTGKELESASDAISDLRAAADRFYRANLQGTAVDRADIGQVFFQSESATRPSPPWQTRTKPAWCQPCGIYWRMGPWCGRCGTLTRRSQTS
ncbi:MAG: hypothetical protein QM682_05715 [Paracoccus sp. (in: a-proteobacteria)]|uniref:hypothetical protein n=1 Tax=Paracoccus sp. TaxID=267 RepID=UPI0039E588EF